ncbi:hypothetical protein SAMN04487962_105113 [Marinobacter segnicrescens]|uniref:DUF6351 domain-containing protein n=1 Tax=Marinobacter segnicrescens TaxID=430453 RepID=A0A1I0CFA0_9GAMM|nr:MULTISPECIES: DUF6351 family protein [Marinobacter]UZD64947.1 DUF6351 family protein [Marinobacter sp. AN1]SET17775.1 hypothetical protein SAMN04487962_105113 [Marinobacter segnicrescens]
MLSNRVLQPLIALLFLAGLAATGHAANPHYDLKVLSSAPDQVSGDDVLVQVLFKDRPIKSMPAVKSRLRQLEFWLNGQPIEPEIRAGRDGHEVLVSGLIEGDNQLELHHRRQGPLASVELTAHPITGPIFSGPQQYPFVCTVTTELGKQPLVDTDGDTGFPVLDESGSQVGLSKDCSIEPYVTFIYRTTDGGWAPLPDDGSRPADMATTTLTDGRTVDFIVRQERGTINRFIYSFATLAQPGDEPWEASTGNWNGRLLFHFEGGVAIGHSQGRISGRSLEPEVLKKGYAVIYSTGTRTSSHYNLQVGGETALMVKEHFIKRFGVPDYTVAIGGSGGGIQQYVYSQNHPDLLDGGVPQYSYPDMITQVIHIGDCELLEHYMDVTDGDNPKWWNTSNRSWLVGLNATDNYLDPFADAKRALGYGTAPGMTECIPAWRGLTALVLNPNYGQARNQELMQPPGVMNDVQWTHYDDARNIYGLDENGNPRTVYDNVGVQYGLNALVEGNITTAEFLKLNARIGGWKHPNDMVQEGFPYLGDFTPANFDPWSRRNMMLSPDGVTPAPRTEADIEAINAAYTSGLVFDGELNMPVIDWRHYLEEVLDMHNSHQSFSARQRIINRMGDAGNQVIWFTDTRPTDLSDPSEPEPLEEYNQTWMALEVLHDWITNIQQNPDRSIAENRPAEAVDACFNTDGSLIEAGDDVWNGILDDNAAGECTEQFQTYTTSRIEAGGPIEGSIFKCSLKPVSEALADGTYGDVSFSAGEIERLEEIYPQGVCDYQAPDQGRPAG